MPCHLFNYVLLARKTVSPVNLQSAATTPEAFSSVNLSTTHSLNIRDGYSCESRHCPQSVLC